MIFSELYSAYYNTVARIITAAFDKNTTEKDLDRIVSENAFSESVLTIMPSLKSGKWKLLDGDLKPLLKHEPTMPLTLLQKRWLKAVSLDKRVRLFDVQFPDLSDVEPLFTEDDYKVYDKYSDGDDFGDEGYIGRFRLIYYAIKNNLPIIARLNNRYGKEVTLRFFPKGFEYSEKDDKIRVIMDGCKYRQLNLGRIINCQLYTGTGRWNELTTFISSSSSITLEAPALMIASSEECLDPTVSISIPPSPAACVKRSNAIRFFSLAPSPPAS